MRFKYCARAENQEWPGFSRQVVLQGLPWRRGELGDSRRHPDAPRLQLARRRPRRAWLLTTARRGIRWVPNEVRDDRAVHDFWFVALPGWLTGIGTLGLAGVTFWLDIVLDSGSLAYRLSQ